MRFSLLIATIALLAGCGRAPTPTPTAEQIAAVATQKADRDATRGPADGDGTVENLVGPDRTAQAMNCVVHIGQISPVPANDRALLNRTSAAWRAALVRETDAQQATQLIASNVNMLADTPAAARQAAVGWCIANAPV